MNLWKKDSDSSEMPVYTMQLVEIMRSDKSLRQQVLIASGSELGYPFWKTIWHYFA